MGIESDRKPLRDEDAPRNSGAWKRLVNRHPGFTERFSIPAPLRPESDMPIKAANEDVHHKYVKAEEQHESIGERTICVAHYPVIVFMTEQPINPETLEIGWHNSYVIQQFLSGEYEMRDDKDRVVARFTPEEALRLFVRPGYVFHYGKDSAGKERVTPEKVMSGHVYRALKEE